jgi:V/A-type H+-transporting ATPase subunit I
LEEHRKEALKKMRRLGVVHLEKVNGASEKLTEFKDTYSKAETAYAILSEIKLPKKAVSTATFDRDKVLAKAEEVVALADRKKLCKDIISAHTLELERFAGWGDLDVENFQYLAGKGIILSLYEIPREAYVSIPETIETMVVNENKSLVRFMLIQHGEAGSTLANAHRPADMPAEAYAVPMISSSSKKLRDEIVALKDEIVSIDKALAEAALDRQLFKQYCAVVGKDIEFENLFSGMAREEDTENGRPYMALCWLTGYVPTEDVAGVQAAAKEENWAIVVSDPGEEDEVPTKLKNNKFVSLIYPVSDFLGTVPGYREYDISGWFLLFFCIFFGIIFGDGGYGLLMVIAAIFADIGAVAKKKKIPPAYNLLLLLGFFTMAWGTVTCTWFGLSTDLLPNWLTSLSLQPISNAYAAISPENEALVKQNLQIFCFMLALIQLSIAHLKGIARYIKSPKCLGELGSLLQLWGIFFVVLNMVVKLDTFCGIPTMGTMVLGVVGVGFALSFIFSNYEGSLGASILESCKNIVSVLLGVVNVFSDIVSYIRLWAVGLAGGAISATVNDMAGPMLGGAIIFLGVLLLVFGHGLNMILNVLSVIVHGVRLNTLEFSSHLGMSWSGFAYEPFCEGADNK